MSSLVSSLRAAVRTSFGYWRRLRARALVVCWPISKLANIASWVLWRKDVLLLVFLAGVASSLDSTLGGSEASDSLIYWRCMFRAATR